MSEHKGVEPGLFWLELAQAVGFGEGLERGLIGRKTA